MKKIIVLLYLLIFTHLVIADPSNTARIYSKPIPKGILQLEKLQLNNLISINPSPAKGAINTFDASDGKKFTIDTTSTLNTQINNTINNIHQIKNLISITQSPDKLASLYFELAHYLIYKEHLDTMQKIANESDENTIIQQCNTLGTENFESHTALTVADIEAIDTRLANDYKQQINNHQNYYKSLYKRSIEELKKQRTITSKDTNLLKALETERKITSQQLAYGEALSQLSEQSDTTGRKNIIQNFFTQHFPGLIKKINDSDIENQEKAIDFFTRKYTALSNPNNCFTNGRWYCLNELRYSNNLSKDPLKLFSGAAIGSSESAQTVKVTALQYDIYLADHLRLPFTIYTADIIEDSQNDQESVTRSKLLDTDLSPLSASISWANKVRIPGGPCDFSNSYGCYIPIQIGARAVRLPTNTIDNDMADNDAPQNTTLLTRDEFQFGAYAKIGINIIFPITPQNQADTIAGHLALSASYIAYKQNISNSANLFPELNDEAGQPLFEGTSYQAVNLNVEFNITDKVSFSARHFDPKGDADVLEPVTSIELSYNIN